MIRVTAWRCVLLTVILVILVEESHSQEDEGPREMMSGIRFRTSPMVRRPVIVPLRRPQLAPSDATGREERNRPTFAGYRRLDNIIDSRESPVIFPDLSEMFEQPPSVANIQNETFNTMDLPDDLDVNNMDLDTMMMMSTIETAEDFRRMFGIEEEPMTNSSLVLAELDASARFGVGSTAEIAVSATCRPEEQTVRLDLPLELNVLYFPRCVRLQRCGGCCTGPLLACQPTDTRPVTLKVIRIVASPTVARAAGNGRTQPSRTRRRRRRRQISQDYLVEDQHHTACACQCRVQERHCNPALHDYIQDECRCRCKNGDEQTKCRGLPSTHYWDNASCACKCLKDEECSTGQYFDDGSCSCVAIPSLLHAWGFLRGAAVDSGEGNELVAGSP